ncbi:carbohydrate kinase family protein [Anaerolineales bacterium HSG24]|nr:carbohydrate kinase family protein [Anaerolineales bacterium HSG24]
MPDIIVIGDINIDVIFSVSGYPIPGSEAVASAVQMHTGGSAVNTAIALANMDMDVGFIGRIGEDTLAKQILADLEKSGVDCSQIQVDPKVSTGLIFIAVSEDSERTMFSARGANAFTDAKELDKQYFANCRWIHLSGYSFLSYHQYQTLKLALDLAENSRYTRVSLDIGTEPATQAKPQILELLPRIDIIFPNEIELAILADGRAPDEALSYLLEEQNANAVVAKHGSKGSMLAVGNKRMHLPAFNVDAKDTTGAGDSCNAGVLLGRLIGLSWGASVALGNAFGGLATIQKGAVATTITRDTVIRLIEKHMFDKAWLPFQNDLTELTMYFEEAL